MSDVTVPGRISPLMAPPEASRPNGPGVPGRRLRKPVLRGLGAPAKCQMPRSALRCASGGASGRDYPLARPLRMSALALLAALLLSSGTAAHAEKILVSNEKDNTVTVLDSDSLALLKTVKVGDRPRGIVLSRDGKSLYICTSDSDHIEVLDIASLAVTRILPSGPDPELFTLSPDGQTLYISNENDNMVSVLDVGAGRILSEIPVGVEPEGMGISPDGRILVNTSETTSMAHFIDTATHDVVANVLVDSRPRVARFTADGEQVWVSAEVGGTVSVIDAKAREVVHKITFDIPGVPTESVQPVGIVLTPDRSLAFVALGPANRVAVVDARTYEVKKYLLVGQRVWNLAFSLDGRKLYTTNGVSNDMSVIDVAALKVAKSVPVGRLPWGVVVAP